MVLRLTGVMLLWAALLGCLLIAPAPMLGRAEAQRAQLAATLDSITPVVDPDTETIVATGSVTNTGDVELTLVKASLWISETPITGRDQLRSAASRSPDTRPGSRIADVGALVDDVADELEPGASATFEVEVPVEYLVEEYDRTTPGVYSIGVDVRGNAAGSFTRSTWRLRTFMPWLPAEITPVEVAYVLPLVAPPSLVDGSTLLDDSALQQFGPDGRLSRLLELGADYDLTFLVDPALLDLARTAQDAYQTASRPSRADGEPVRKGSAVARDFLERARGVLAGQETYLLPYADPDLSALERGGLADPFAAAIETSEEAAAEFGTMAEPITWPGAGFASAEVLERIAESGGETALLQQNALPTLPTDGTSPVASVVTPAGSLSVLVSDPALTGSGPGGTSSPLQVRQRFLSETALLAMLPGDEDTLRRVVATFPRGFEPGGRRGSILEIASEMPWLRQISTGALLSPPPTAYGGELRYPASQVDRELDAPVLGSLRDLEDASIDYLDLLAEPTEARESLTLSYLRGASFAWRSDPDQGTRLNRVGADRLEQRVQSSVELIASKVVTLSEERGRFPITIENRLDEAVVVDLDVLSGDRGLLSFEPIEPVQIASGRKETISVTANAEGGGAVEVEARVRTVRTEVQIGPTTVFQVRVTGYGQIGWAVIGIGVTLLVLALAVRVVRRIRRARTTEPSDPEETGPVHER